MSEPARAAASARLAAARARLILEKPFIGVLLLHLPLTAAGWCRTVATDARRIYYNPDYVAQLDARGLRFVLAHQVLHCALGHFARRGSRLRTRWDAACDYCVNLLLADEGLEPVPGALLDPRLRGLSAEEIYPLVPEETVRDFDAHLFEPGDTSGGTRERGATVPSESATDDAAALAGSPDALDSDAVSQARRSVDGAGFAANDADLLDAEALAQRWQMRFALAA